MFYDKIIKLCVIGDAGNGKTSLINKFAYNNFDQNNGETVGIDFKSKIIDIKNANTSDITKKIKINVWDTAGQERFKDIIKVCYRDADGIIVTYDTTNHISFEHLTTWFEKINDVIIPLYTTIILVGTKCDLVDLRSVSSIEIAEFINKYNIKYLETSSKEGKNIDMLFQVFAEIVYKNIEKNPKPEQKKKRIKLSNQESKQNKIKNNNCCIVN